MHLILASLSFLPLLSSVGAWPAFGRSLHTEEANTRAGPVLRHTAAPYTTEFPYAGAKLDGNPGTGVGGIQVPAPGDFAHYYEPPLPGAQRGPCPGMNTLANHGFLSRDGLTTYTELVAAMQNVYNIEWDLAVILAVLGVATDGDPVSEMLSLGSDATQQTGEIGQYTGNFGGLSRHNGFELDVSLTRDDFYLYGDAHTFNASLFKMMADTAADLHDGVPIFDFNTIALHRAQRYNQSLAENPWLIFPSAEIHNYGAGVFVFEAFPSSARNMTPDLETVASFFGAVPLPNGQYASQPERIPEGWHNRVNVLPGTDIDNVGTALYQAYPVPFIAGDGAGGFINLTSSTLVGGCATYQTALSTAQGSRNPIATYKFVRSKLDPLFASQGCVTNATLQQLFGNI